MSSDISKSERSQKWDILKFILIFTVVLGHAADKYTGSFEHMRSLFFFIYIFHMPLFIFVSGLFAKKTVNEKRFDKITGYLLLYFVLNLYVYFVKLLAGGNPELKLLDQGGAPWFMIALFFFNLITIAIRKLPKAAMITLSIVLACIIGYFPDVRDFLASARVVVYYPFFLLGYYADRQKIETFCEGKTKKVVAAVILLATSIFVFVQGDEIYWLRYLLTGRNPYYISLGDANPCITTPDINENFGFLFRFAYFAIVIIISGSLIVLVPKKTPFGICAKLGQRTLAVYGLHFGILHLIYNVFKLKPFFAETFGLYHEWIIIPIALAITFLLSLEFLNTGLTFVMNVPSKIYEKVKSK